MTAADPTPAKTIVIDYTNWRGERRFRPAIPIEGSLWFGCNDYHPQDQWFLRAVDPEDGQEKDFPLASIQETIVPGIAPRWTGAFPSLWPGDPVHFPPFRAARKAVYCQEPAWTRGEDGRALLAQGWTVITGKAEDQTVIIVPVTLNLDVFRNHRGIEGGLVNGRRMLRNGELP